MWIFKSECVNRLNQSYFVIWPNSFYQLSDSTKNDDNLELELEYQHNLWTMDVETSFSQFSHLAWSAPASSTACLFVSLEHVTYVILRRHRRFGAVYCEME